MIESNINKSSMRVASLVLGILSIVFSAVLGVAVPLGVLAIVFGAISVFKMRSSLGRAGLILGIIGLVMSTTFYTVFFWIMFFGSL